MWGLGWGCLLVTVHPHRESQLEHGGHTGKRAEPDSAQRRRTDVHGILLHTQNPAAMEVPWPWPSWAREPMSSLLVGANQGFLSLATMSSSALKATFHSYPSSGGASATRRKLTVCVYWISSPWVDQMSVKHLWEQVIVLDATGPHCLVWHPVATLAVQI